MTCDDARMESDLIGKQARTTTANLGAMPKEGGRMVERQFPEGTPVTVVMRLPDDDRYTDWYALEVEDDASIYIPAHESMFEVVE